METDSSHLFLMHCYPCTFFPTKWLNDIHFSPSDRHLGFVIIAPPPSRCSLQLICISHPFTLFSYCQCAFSAIQLNFKLTLNCWTCGVAQPLSWYYNMVWKNAKLNTSAFIIEKKIYKGKPEEPRMYPTHGDVWTITRVVTSHLFISRHALWWCTLTGSPCENLVHVGLRYWCRKPCKKEKHPKDV